MSLGKTQRSNHKGKKLICSLHQSGEFQSPKHTIMKVRRQARDKENSRTTYRIDRQLVLENCKSLRNSPIEIWVKNVTWH